MYATRSRTTSPKPATPKQLAFILKLCAERNLSAPDYTPDTATAASGIIDGLLAIPKLVLPTAANPNPVKDVGMYRDAAGTIYKIQRGKESGALYAKKLVTIAGDRLNAEGATVNFSFQYDPGAIKSLTEADRLSIEDAKKFGLEFGVCCVCGKTLVDAKSVAAGIGPVCAKRL